MLVESTKKNNLLCNDIIQEIFIFKIHFYIAFIQAYKNRSLTCLLHFHYIYTIYILASNCNNCEYVNMITQFRLWVETYGTSEYQIMDISQVQ